MILSLAYRYQKHIALFLLSISFVQVTIAERMGSWNAPRSSGIPYTYEMPAAEAVNVFMSSNRPVREHAPDIKIVKANGSPGTRENNQGVFIGGPSQPESQSFSSVNSNNMVDLFTGDFSYNIPLLDVGGYPVNIAYHCGITMDEEASWVGLGWNINPGSITRNMRGVPDDFNGGADTMTKVSSIKPNKNWGVTVGADFELFGLSAYAKNNQIVIDTVSKGITVGGSFGIFHNTYKGWGFERSLNASINVGNKSTGTLSGGLSLTDNSQEGITIRPSLSYQYTLNTKNENFTAGAGISLAAPYNSRTGLKAIQLGMNVKPRIYGISRRLEAGLDFAWPTYSPSITMPMTNSNTSVTIKVGYEAKGTHPTGYISGYWGQEYIAPADTAVSIPVFGYLNYQNLVGNRDAVTDFNREKEMIYREKPAIPHIAVPSYTYDVFSMSGEGTGGSFRPYRGDIGFIADHRSRTKTTTGAASVDIGLGDAVHGGVDLNRNYSYTQTGPWESENIIGNTINFKNSKNLFEAVYFRNPAEKTINTTAFYDAIGGDDVVVPALAQDSRNSPSITASNTLNRYRGKTKVGSIDINAASAARNTRDKRSQVITYLTAQEAAVSGLDKYIYHHTINKFGSRHCDDVSVSDKLGNGVGVIGYYYPNREFKPPYFNPTQLNSTIYFDWERWTPYWLDKKGYPKILIDKNFVNDNFTVRWLGSLKAPVTGTYDFGVRMDDRCRLWMNDTLLFDNWKPGSGPDWMTRRINLVKDHFYKLRVEYIELGGNGYAHMAFAWRRPDQQNRPWDKDHKDSIPGIYMYPPTYVDTAIVDEVITREDRVNNFRKSNHISEINVLNADGRRYVYGIPVYNIQQKEVSFSVTKDNRQNNQTGMTSFSSDENSTRNTSGKSGYYSRQETPAYAHSFLLTGILSPDYVDVTSNGISDDDIGDAVKFNYAKSAGIASPFEWRAPYNDSANYSEGLKTYNRDDKAHYISGKKEMWYLHSIESKTMIATFTLQHREDLQAISESGVKLNSGKAYSLKQIDLYSKADFLARGTNATPVKTVHFEYSYELCRGINKFGNNQGNDSGKLTLKKIWFTYNGNEKGKLNPYVFYYHNNNPRYTSNASDKWGTYKDPAQNPDATAGNPLTNADYPYAIQDSALAAYNAAAWMLDSIKLPSGGRIKVKYESDDYAYVQNRRSTQMLQLAGFGQTSSGSYNDRLYTVDGDLSTHDHLFAYVRIPVPVSTKAELFARYLEGMSKLYFRLYVQMPDNDGYGSGSEYVPCYAEPDVAAANWYGFTNDPNVIWIKMAGVNNDGDGGGSLSPLAQAAINYLRLNLPSKAYYRSEPGDDLNPMDAVRVLVPSLPDLSNMLLGYTKSARFRNQAAHTVPARSYVRLNCATGKKLGGGLRVKTILIYDHWNAMTQKKETVLGQNYDYTTTQTIHGKETRVSSGVAAWEPVIGAEENPFHLPIEYQDRVSIMAPTAAQYSEEPLGEAFFPGASVGYSKVRVRSIHTDKTRSANGYAETRFYTTYDFPTTWDWSVLDNDTKKRYKPLLRNFLRIDAKSFLSIAQGFKVELNDMNGKLRSEASYAENDAKNPVSHAEYFYHVENGDVTFKQLKNLVTTIDPYGNVDTAATIGKDVELMADMRDQTSVSIGANVNVNSDFFTVGSFPALIPSLIPLFQKETNQFRSAAMTKVIRRYGIIDSVVVIDKGSRISTKNILYDAETGDPLLTRTQNEFNDPVYNFNYPAHWVYKGVGPAYQNIGAILEHLEVKNGKITDGLNGLDTLYLTAGDELLVYSKETINATGCSTSSYAFFPDSYKLWVIDSNAVNGGPQQLFLVDKNGTPFSGNDITLKVTRSGHRNMNGSVGTVTSLRSPLVRGGDGKYHLVFDTATKVVNAAASELAQYWKVADKRKMDVLKDCVPTSNDSARFANEACSCMKPFFDHLIQSNQLFVRGFLQRKTISQLVSEINTPGFNVNNCPILKENLNSYFRPVSADPNGEVYTCRIGNIEINLLRRNPSSMSFYDLTTSTCTSEGVIYKSPNVVIPEPDTVTVRIAPDFSASMLSTQNCPTFRDSLTLIDSTSDRLLVETNLNLGGAERNAISILRFNNVSQIPARADILSARLILQADQRGHHSTYWPDANSMNLVDSLSVSLSASGWFPRVPLESLHEQLTTSPWHREVRRTVPFQNDTIDVKEYVDGYRNRDYTSASFILAQGTKDFHTNVSGYGAGYEGAPGYMQSGYGNYYSTIYSQRYADAAKWPVMEVTYVVYPPFPDTMGAVLRYNSTLQCTDISSGLCYSAITDTTINPYQYGILGNYRPLRSYVYYGRRMESDPMQPINTRKNGVIKDFAPFWILQGKNWVPSYDTTRWVWNAQTTLFNRKGFELENKDPLGRYNAGIYGYGLTLPVAVLQNSHFQEGAYEGFEDYGFETNNCDNACPVARSFDWSSHQDDFTKVQSHSGLYSLKVDKDSLTSISAEILPAADAVIPTLASSVKSGPCGNQLKGMLASKSTVLPNFAPIAGKKVIVGGWVKEDNSCQCKTYTRNHILVGFTVGGTVNTIQLSPSGNLVEGWQRYEAVVEIPANATKMTLTLQASDSATTYFDDIRIHPFNAQMKSFVYNAVNLRLMAELDENNYATFYEYDDDGTLVRVKKETERGVQTVKESRSALIKEEQ
ncbi:PA14 domain-containing protein [Longitalea arenae]|uniref:PA14 domain-containing protein n=1 Tax=Longitalea arenae TaxID=2812558 RepID=UPI001967EB4D|nr:PA14 domain-containing protein [Longitalea arenae]